ncbi:hypothetical protein EKN56_05905 [Limnobaculum zhutongyuii]|uniref:Uncharacterized protein n=1 Tax=Limnobaculum zhutongyuii TaxID=2498113 RepID=A0A411WIH1_9GAMM|nr:hypothetical protein [Limnobaculum zhutongyuii]QBH95976.1 hypothetical protein EKN56_05905 [Limnobaculum zhutongyuii]TQS89314.1 hypothetical protein ELQ32_06020 [Limnobaculum zhutongyuii]
MKLLDNPYYEHLKLSKRQLTRLDRMVKSLTEMSCDWDGLDNGMESDLDFFARELSELCRGIQELRGSWNEHHD